MLDPSSEPDALSHSGSSSVGSGNSLAADDCTFYQFNVYIPNVNAATTSCALTATFKNAAGEDVGYTKFIYPNNDLCPGDECYSTKGRTVSGQTWSYVDYETDCQDGMLIDWATMVCVKQKYYFYGFLMVEDKSALGSWGMPGGKSYCLSRDKNDWDGPCWRNEVANNFCAYKIRFAKPDKASGWCTGGCTTETHF